MAGRMANKATLITGGGSGIGLATALAFAKQGAKLGVWRCLRAASFVTGYALAVDGGYVAQ
jgi:NADP-dependent 3-hydroxy acid dehydrogenase YdfG